MTPLERALALARGGQAALDAARTRLNDLNVYPVPDGDTGSNLADTAARLTDGLAAAAAAPADRAAIARVATRAALMGARGNSGVILSQMVRGFAETLGGGPLQVDAAALARALRAASDAAYGAVRQPVEGTMLTAMREMAEAAERHAAAGGSVEGLLDAALAAGEVAVESSPQRLAALAQAGVVDAGAAGLVEYVRGAVAGMRGEAGSVLVRLPEPPPATIDALHATGSAFRYCTSFLVEGDDVDRALLEDLLDPLGDSLLVVGEPPAVKVHLHTDDPGAALSLAVRLGTVEGVDIANMEAGTRRRTLRLLRGEAGRLHATALVAVAAGGGAAEAFRAAAGAAVVVGGGQSDNPSAGEIAHAISVAPGDGAVVLPNNRNVVLAAEHAAGLGGRPARVVPTLSAAAGLVLAGRFDPALPLEENARRLGDLNVTLRCGELVEAARDASMDGIDVCAGQQLALVEGTLVAARADAADAARLLVERLAEGAGRLTLLTGEGAAFADDRWVEQLRRRHPGIELRVVAAGQPGAALLACAEPARPAPSRAGRPPLRADTTAVVLDSTADLADPGARHPNWSMVPLTVSFGDGELRDYLDITPEQFYERLAQAPRPPRTAAPSPGAWQAAFERLDGYRRVLVLPVSSRVSASAHSAELAARAVDPGGARITVLETASVSLGTVLLADGMQRLLVRGVAENELMMWLEGARQRLGVVFAVDTLDYLRRGGRIGRAGAAVGGLLGLRPVLTLRDGEVAPLRRVRGAEGSSAAFEQFLAEHAPEGAAVRVAVAHAAAPDAAEQLVQMVRRRRPHASVDHVGGLGAVVGAHGGPGTLGLAVLPEPA